MPFSLTKTSFSYLWDKFAKSKTFREQFVAGYVKRSIPAQIRHLMKIQALTQSKLATRAGLTQGVISRAADVNYGDLTLNTLVRIAAGFDCAFIGKFVPFSEFAKDADKKIDVDIPTFEQENEQLKRELQEPPEEISAQKSSKGLGAISNKEADDDTKNPPSLAGER